MCEQQRLKMIKDSYDLYKTRYEGMVRSAQSAQLVYLSLMIDIPNAAQSA